MFKKGTGYSKACFVLLMLVLRLGKKDLLKIVSLVGLRKRLSAKVTGYH